jgi:hypothetical protein
MTENKEPFGRCWSLTTINAIVKEQNDPGRDFPARLDPLQSNIAAWGGDDWGCLFHRAPDVMMKALHHDFVSANV